MDCYDVNVVWDNMSEHLVPTTFFDGATCFLFFGSQLPIGLHTSPSTTHLRTNQQITTAPTVTGAVPVNRRMTSELTTNEKLRHLASRVLQSIVRL